jgi:DME family drug/metabolite transporter
MTATADLPVRRGRHVVGHPVTAVLLGSMLFGTAGVGQAFAPAEASPVAVGTMRLAVGALAITAYVLVRGVTVRYLLAMWRSRAILVATVGATAYQPFFFGGVSLTGVPIGTLVAVGSAPVLTGLLSWVLLRERPSRAWGVATVICVAGLALLTGTGAAAGDVVGIALSAGAGLSISMFTVSAKTLLARGVPTMEVLASTFLLGALVMVPVAAWLGLGWVGSGPGLAVVLYLGLATMGVANILFTRGLGGLPAGAAVTLTLADPLTATVLGAWLLEQRLTAGGWVGLAVLFLGLVLHGVWSSRRS